MCCLHSKSRHKMQQTPDTAVLAGIGCGGSGREESKGGG